MKDPLSCSHSDKIEKYLKRPEELVFETDDNFLCDKEAMMSMSLRFKKDAHLAYLPKDLKNDEDFMLQLIKERASAYRFAGLKLSKSPDFTVLAIKTNPDCIDDVFLKHENYFNSIQVVNEALKHEQSDFFSVTDEIDTHIHKKNICSKSDLLEMFSGKSRCDYLINMYAEQVLAHSDDFAFIERVSEYNDFSDLEIQVEPQKATSYRFKV